MTAAEHDAYVRIATATWPLGRALLQMTVAARAAGDALMAEGVTPLTGQAAARAAAVAEDLGQRARRHLDRLGGSPPPHHLATADGALRDALLHVIDAASRGTRAARDRDALTLYSAAAEADLANDDLTLATRRISGWRAGTPGV